MLASSGATTHNDALTISWNIAICTASVITDSAGVIKAESDYYPWGGELKFVDNDTNDYKLTGKKRDLETGLDYFGARYYSNGLGRWVSADWSSTPVPVPYANFGDPQSLNLYTYVRNIPTTGLDADGHCWPLCQAIEVITGIARDGGVKPYFNNAGTGFLKGGGHVGVGLAGALADKLVPGGAAHLATTKIGMKAASAVTPSNTTQAQYAGCLLIRAINSDFENVGTDDRWVTS